MDTVQLIGKTRDNIPLTAAEIEFLVAAYTAGEIPDYQMAAWLMAVYCRGLTRGETVALTLAMAHSGEIIRWPDAWRPITDKHSTGGVGDTTTLIVAPIVAAAGVRVGKMSGRGLGFTGGTLDKLESVPGFSVQLSAEAFRRQIETLHLAVIGQSEDLAPADGLMYALRDVTGTVESLPLIASSVMSKKLASGADVIVLDVKCGAAAFMKTREEAEVLARLMVAIGEQAGRRTLAIVSDMNAPLGSAVGNSLEIDEATEVLQGHGNRRLIDVSLTLAGAMIYGAGKADDWGTGIARAREVWESGQAFSVWKEWLSAQGGRVDWVGHRPLTQAAHVHTVMAQEEGVITGIDAMVLAQVSRELGAGRMVKEDTISPMVGLRLHCELNDTIQRGDALVTVYSDDMTDEETLAKRLRRAFILGREAADIPLIYERIDGRADLTQ